MNMRRYEVRERLLKHLPTDSVGAEIGVWKGDFSAIIKEIVKPKMLHLVDPWLYQPDFENASFGREKFADEVEGYYEDVVKKYGDDPTVKIHRMTSDEAFAQFEDGSLDWVYLDGNHNSPFIERDLENSLLKVKPNGRIAGDDLHWKSDGLRKPVYNAVMAVNERLGEQAGLKVIGSQFVFRLNRA